jgi:ribonuclease J
MLKKSNNLKIYEKGLYFLSLGGIGEIGANSYLYCCDGKWIMIDLGLSFADEQFPGVDLLVPKIDFLEEIKDNLQAVIISHGHEDHAGAVAYLADKIECPVYASSFPKLLIENRLKEFGKLDSINLIELESTKKLSLVNFNLRFIDTTHSIPQPQAIVIETKYGNLLHTADWKIDVQPTLGKAFNKNSFIDLGNDGVLALIGDSTNANIPGFSHSEEEVKDELKQVFSRYINRIVVTCFSSNIARIINIVNAAKKNNRKIALIGRSMKKNIEAAIKSSLIKDSEIFISEEEAALIPKENIVIICTGSQGEKRSALYRIAYNSHRNIHLEKDDVVIFSSRDIPGNEKSINALKNLLIRQKVEIITADDDLVHVSGHGHAEEIKQMYNWTKPFISIPVHGEAMHLESHKKISEASQVPVTKILQNGKCLKIAPGDCSIVDDIKTGKLIVEGKYLYDSESDFIRDRRKYSYEGIALLSLVINDDLSIDKNIQLSFFGLPCEEIDLVRDGFITDFMQNYLKLNEGQKSSYQNVKDLIKKSLKSVLKNILQKKPEIKIHLIRK